MNISSFINQFEVHYCFNILLGCIFIWKVGSFEMGRGSYEIERNKRGIGNGERGEEIGFCLGSLPLIEGKI